MEPVTQFATGDAIAVVFARDQPAYFPLPALLYPDGLVLTEWRLTEAERAAIARGENLRLWIWKGVARICTNCGHKDPSLLQPVAIALTDERKG